jgi:endonuclease YncB( thermonuclease family)/RNA polymerase subunit RPABC4/transcription elongation factor Spt4
MKECTVCHAESPDDANYCGSCGTRFAEPNSTKVCPKCQAQVLEKEDSCPNCGQSFILQPMFSIQPVDRPEIIEIDQTIAGMRDRLGFMLRWLKKYWRLHPYRMAAAIALILLLPLCCIINTVFAIRGMLSLAKAPEENAITEITPAVISPRSSEEVKIAIATPTLTLEAFTATTYPTSTGTPTQLYINTGFTGCPPPIAAREMGKVARVVDGDTIDVILNDKTVRVRYIGIDAPESADSDRSPQSYGSEAYQKNSELVQGKEVSLIQDVSHVDGNDRLLRYVFVGDIFINYELVRQGYAKVLPSPPDVACDGYFNQAQQAASLEKAGLWGVTGTAIPVTQPAVRFVEPTQALEQPTQAVSGAVTAGAAACECTGPDLDCKDFPSGSAAQECFDHCNPQYGDIFRLDRDKDGLACESK